MSSPPDLSSMKPGDDHYMAYVGPPGEFDVMGATQFRLLTALGLRAHHKLLDFGCGSLRAGKLFISYLDAGCYFGIDPNFWLIEEAIKHETGKDLISIKTPRFDTNSDFKTDVFGTKFDFILAQSVFSHAGGDFIRKALENFRDSLNPEGLLAVTFMEGETDFEGGGWVYPECVRYHPSTIYRFASDTGLHIRRLPWHHPRQCWYLCALNEQRLPPASALSQFTGYTCFSPDETHPWSNPHLKPQPSLNTAGVSEPDITPQPRRSSFLGRLFSRLR